MKKIPILICLFALNIIGCNSNSDKQFEKHQKARDNIKNVSKNITDIKTDFIISKPEYYIIKDILIIHDLRPEGNKGIHLYNKNTFEYITSTGIRGKGPGEITRPGFIGINEKDSILWVQDHGKLVMWKFHLDSILNNKKYKPTEKIALNNDFFIEEFDFLNDSLVLGRAIDVIDNSSYRMAMAKRNLNTNKIKKYGYEHSKVNGEKKSRFTFDLSVDDSLYVKNYFYSDLITICDLEGKLQHNVYGPGWSNNKDNKKNYFSGVEITNNHIIASYLGEAEWIFNNNNKNNRPDSNYPTKFLVFDLEGNYKKTIETGHEFTHFCVDNANNRVLVYFRDRENPLGYFNLDFDQL